MKSFLHKFQYYLNRKSLRYGLPFLLLIVGGSFALKEFAQLRYQFSRNKTLTPSEAEKYGIQMKKPGEVTLESEYEKLKQMNLDDWEQKRISRPWEENSN